MNDICKIGDNTKIYAIKVIQKHNKYFITSKTKNRKTINKQPLN